MSYLEFRHLVPSSDEAERQRLFVDAFPELKGTSVDSLKHYLWKFRTFPSSKPAYEYLAVNSQEFLGYYAALPYSYQLSGKSALAGMVCDVMTSSQSRGQGIFTKIGHFATSEMQKMGLDFTTGYPIRPGVIPGHLKVGWKVVFPLPLYLRVFKSKNLLKKIKVSFLSPVVDIFFSLYRILSHLPAASSEYIGSVMSPEFFFQSENQYNDFFESWRKQVPNHLIKDFKFLKK